MRMSITLSYKEHSAAIEQAKADGWHYRSYWYWNDEVGVIEDKEAYECNMKREIEAMSDETIATALINFNPEDKMIDNVKRMHVAIGGQCVRVSRMIYDYFIKLKNE